MPKNNRRVKLSDPISIAAHQLKNPISILKVYLEVLLSEDFGKINEKQAEYLRDAFTNVQRMARIVSDVLDVSRIEEKRYEMKPGVVDLANITQETVEGLHSLAQASNCEILFDKPKDPLWVFADSFKVGQVIENLISNAIQYKSSGNGRVEVQLQKKSNEVLFVCRDNGMSIPAPDRRKVFSKFYRSQEALEVDPSGTGLGLYISKAIIELSRGTIWFEKNKGRGMTFYFTLPSHTSI